MSDENIPIRIRVFKDDPIDLTTLSKSFLALNSILNDFIAQKNGLKDTTIKLKSVEKGSDIFELYVVFCGGVLAFSQNIEIVNSFFEFLRNFKLIGKKSVDEIKSDEFLTKKTLNNLNDLTDLSQNADVSYEFNNYKDCVIINANNIQSYKEAINTAKKIKGFETSDNKEFKSVLIKIDTIKDSQRVVKDRVICDDIIPKKPVATEILNLDEKNLIKENPFGNYFLVDLVVNKIDDEIKLYTVTKLHKIISKGDENDSR